MSQSSRSARCAPAQLSAADARLNIVSAAVWNAERILKLVDKGSPAWHHWYGRHCALIVLLQRFGAFPTGSFERSQSIEELCRSLSIVRAVSSIGVPVGIETCANIRP